MVGRYARQAEPVLLGLVETLQRSLELLSKPRGERSFTSGPLERESPVETLLCLLDTKVVHVSIHIGVAPVGLPPTLPRAERALQRVPVYVLQNVERCSLRGLQQEILAQDLELLDGERAQHLPLVPRPVLRASWGPGQERDAVAVATAAALVGQEQRVRSRDVLTEQDPSVLGHRPGGQAAHVGEPHGEVPQPAPGSPALPLLGHRHVAQLGHVLLRGLTELGLLATPIRVPLEELEVLFPVVHGLAPALRVAVAGLQKQLGRHGVLRVSVQPHDPGPTFQVAASELLGQGGQQEVDTPRVGLVLEVQQVLPHETLSPVLRQSVVGHVVLRVLWSLGLSWRARRRSSGIRDGWRCRSVR